jgi:hypothetical protein
VAIEFENNSERIFDIDHPVGFFVWKVFPHRHPLRSACRDDFGQEAFKVRVLDCKMERAVLTEGQVFLWSVVSVELEKLETDTISGREVCDTQLLPPGPKTSVHI